MITSGANEIFSTRTLAVPREQVWHAFSDPAKLARWWGPTGFTNTIHEFDLRAGGRWRFTMKGPDGSAFEQTRRFLEVVPPSRIVMTNDNPLHRFQMTIILRPDPTGARIEWRMNFDDPAEFARVKDIIAASNEENFDRLETVLRAAA